MAAESRNGAKDADDQPAEADGWGVALFAYFVGLIVLVAALLIVPALY